MGSGDGYPVQIIAVNDDNHSFTLNEEALKDIFTNEKIKDKHLSIISVAGAFRRGKSFLLDFLLRYLSAGGSESWMGEEDEFLEGFSWRGGGERETTGILIWSKVFLMTSKTHGEIAVVLMDTQGAFDSTSTVKDCATIFALSAMMSSLLIYNVSSNIQEDDLQHLQLFTEYGRLALEEDSGEIPFQKLIFLVRDWSYPYEAPYGFVGGNSVLAKRLQINSKQHSELQSLRKHISSCFSSIDGFLLPHPGLKVATDPSFKGQLKDIDPVFIESLKDFISRNLKAESLVLKRIGGSYLRCQDVTSYFKVYVQVFQGETMPEPKSLLEATSEANNLSSLSLAKESYVARMEAIVGGECPYMSESTLQEKETIIREEALEVFGQRKKMGGEEFSAKYREKLILDLDEMFSHYASNNESKNLFKTASTPITLCSLALIFYLLSQILSLLSLSFFANIANLFNLGTFSILGLWIYFKLTGEHGELGIQIDNLASFLWETFFVPLLLQVSLKGTELLTTKSLESLTSVGKSKKKNS